MMEDRLHAVIDEFSKNKVEQEHACSENALEQEENDEVSERRSPSGRGLPAKSTAEKDKKSAVEDGSKALSMQTSYQNSEEETMKVSLPGWASTKCRSSSSMNNPRTLPTIVYRSPLKKKLTVLGRNCPKRTQTKRSRTGRPFRNESKKPGMGGTEDVVSTRWLQG